MITLRMYPKDISTYRAELMGFAILWIMSYHFSFSSFKIFHAVAQYGYAGVEIFMFVSGFGIYYSLDKNKNIFNFYKKRFIRIFPIYYAIGAIDSFFIFHDDIPSFFYRYSTIGFWTGSIYGDWYIPSITMLYVVSPFIKKFIIDKKKFFWATIILLLIIAFYFTTNCKIDRAHYFFIYRIPSFILGMKFGFLSKNKTKCNVIYFLAALGVPTFIILFNNYNHMYNLKFYSFTFIFPLLLILAILTFKTISPPKVLSKIGQASLEIYLVQGVFYHLIINNIILMDNSIRDDLYTIIFIACSSTLGYYLHSFIIANIFKLQKLRYEIK